MPRLYENLKIWNPDDVDCAGKFQIPRIIGHQIPSVNAWWPFNYCLGGLPAGDGCHMFVDDYQIQRLWNTPTKYIDALKNVHCVCSPDFSMYTDTPCALNLYNHYRKHWLGAYWQRLGINVIPTICWSDADSFDWCFDGEPERSAVAVSSMGTRRRAEDKAAFMLGYDAMLERLQPSQILFYGSVPTEARGNIIHIEPFYKEIEGRRKGA